MHYILMETKVYQSHNRQHRMVGSVVPAVDGGFHATVHLSKGPRYLGLIESATTAVLQVAAAIAEDEAPRVVAPSPADDSYDTFLRRTGQPDTFAAYKDYQEGVEPFAAVVARCDQVISEMTALLTLVH